MLFETIAELSSSLKKKAFSSVELTQFYLNRIKQLDGSVNSFITVTEDRALAQAKAADQRIADGSASPLTGIPLAQKDIFCTHGVRTTCASKMLESFVPPYESSVTQRFSDTGAVMLGKTNMDEFAMGSSNENSYFGAVKNPWNLNTIPGGSSGGSAAAVAGGLAVAATGTDTGGSIRQPAALCGITGIKPTYGRVSRYGMIAFASSLDQAGPMTRTAEDAAIMLNAMAGHDDKDSTSIPREVPDYTATLNDSIKGLKIGLPKEYFTDALNPTVQGVMDDTRKTLESLGAQCVEISLPHTEYAPPAYYVIAPAECSSNLARYDGIRYGYRCDSPKDLDDLYKRSRGEAFGKEVKRRIMIGTYALSSGYYDAYYTKAQRIRHLIRDDFTKAFERVDCILAPTTPTAAFALGEKQSNPLEMYLSDVFTIAVNLAGLPALSMPAGFDEKGLPLGAQLIGNLFNESKILNVAHQFQQHSDWHTKTPNFTEGASS